MKPGLITVVAIATIFFSCNKDDNSSPSPTYNQSFKWTFGSTSYIADSSAANQNGSSNKPTILAWNKGSAIDTFKIAFKITSFNPGAYTFITTASGYYPPPPTDYSNFLYYFGDNGNQLEVINGGVNILSNVNGRISGDFSANLLDADGAHRYLVGSFTDISTKP